MGLKIGVCGVGMFGGAFVRLFKAHPLVDEVSIADLFPERLAEQAARFGVDRTFRSLDELCASDVDAIAIITQRWLHGPQALQALRAGKHVYSAVPTAVTLQELEALVRAVEETGLTYMLGETSYYYPTTVYCRERFKNGDFGRFVYAEAEYYHDMSHGFYEAYQHSGGAEWKRYAGFPPMLYPTHSVSMVLSVTGARMTQVSCLGFIDAHEDGVFRVDANMWQNVYSNESGLFRTSDGGICRINEFRRVGQCGRSVRMSLYGTEASYEEQANAQVWVTRARQIEDVSALLTCAPQASVDDDEQLHAALRQDFHSGLAPVHRRERLPEAFRGLPNGHEGSHQFLVDDFVKSVTRGVLPPNHIWAATRYCAPGIVAHESARREGEVLPIPDFGGPPLGARLLAEQL